MNLSIIIFIFAWQFIGDFVLQINWMALNKSKRLLPLTAHVIVYSSGLFFIGWKFALLNGAAHWLTDFVTSRLSSKAWKSEKRHLFFVIIGADQMIHHITLFSSYLWLFK